MDIEVEIGKCYRVKHVYTHYYKVLSDRLIHTNSHSIISVQFYCDEHFLGKIFFLDDNKILLKDFTFNDGALDEIQPQLFESAFVKCLYYARFLEFINPKKLINASHDSIRTIHDLR
jgi:hypothetical protein